MLEFMATLLGNFPFLLFTSQYEADLLAVSIESTQTCITFCDIKQGYTSPPTQHVNVIICLAASQS